MSEAIFEFKNPYTGKILKGKDMRLEAGEKDGQMFVVIEVQYPITGPQDTAYEQVAFNKAQRELRRKRKKDRKKKLSREEKIKRMKEKLRK